MAALQDAGHRCVLACKAKSRIATEATARGLTWHAVPFCNSLHLPSIVRVRGVIRRYGVDTVMCHSGHDADVAAIAARLIYRRPAIIRVRTYLAKPARPRTVNWLTDMTLVPSKFLRNQILSDPAIRADRVAVLRPLVPLQSLRADAENALPEELVEWFDQHSPIIAHVAMLRSEKGHQLALSALANLRKRYPNLGYLIAGSGKKEKSLRKQVEKLGFDGNVRFAGLVIPAAPLMARSDLVIMPSRSEPLGLSQIEALSLGVPVAVSDTGGLPETVTNGKTGWVIPSDDVKAWSRDLDTALSDPSEAKRRAEAGRAWVEKTFSPEAFCVSLLERVSSLSESGGNGEGKRVK